MTLTSFTRCIIAPSFGRMFLCGLQMTDMTGVDTVVVEGVEVMVALGSLGARVTGNVTDAELTTLPLGADAMHVEQTKPLKEVTEVQIGVMATAEVEVMVIVEAEVTEEPLLSSLGIGTAQTAVPTILQADKHAINAVAKSERCLMQLFCQICLCRLAGTVLAALSAWLWVQLGFLWCWCPSLGFGCAGWLLGSGLKCLGSGTCFSSGLLAVAKHGVV